ncbi:MAG: methylamine utilization protein [Steroidobacteraceae bacterium]
MAARLAGLLLSLMVCSAAWATDLQVRVTQVDGKPLHGAVVTVHALGVAAAAAPIAAVMDQVDLAFAPDLLVIPVGSTVSFPNTDKVSHEVYSFSSAHRFQLGLYRGKAPPPQLFDKAGIVTLGCNIHDAMLAYILVTDAAYYGMTRADGTWVQPEVARGRYRIEVWSPRLQEPGQMLTHEIVVNPGDHAVAEIRTDKALRPAPLQQRPHSWDAY